MRGIVLEPDHIHLAMDRAQAAWSTGDLYRRTPCQGLLKMQINKSDRNDAIGIARIMQTGWFKEVHVKDIDSHSVRALLASRAARQDQARSREPCSRPSENLGLVIGRAKFNVFAVRAEELIEGRPELIAAIRPLLERGMPSGSRSVSLTAKL